MMVFKNMSHVKNDYMGVHFLKQVVGEEVETGGRCVFL